MSIISIFSDRLLELIKSQNITKKEFLAIIDTNKNAFSYWTKHDNIPKCDTLLRIAEFFDVSIDYLIGRCDAPCCNSCGTKTKDADTDYSDMTDDELRDVTLKALNELEKRKKKQELYF